MIFLKEALGQLSLGVGFFFASYGLGSIVYGYYTLYGGLKYTKLDQIIMVAGFPLTLIATIITLVSVYMPINETRPWVLSKIVSLPMIIFLCAMAIEAMLNSRYPNEAIVNGVALIGLGGAILRTIPRPHED
jgi:hypothetical protein